VSTLASALSTYRSQVQKPRLDTLLRLSAQRYTLQAMALSGRSPRRLLGQLHMQVRAVPCNHEFVIPHIVHMEKSTGTKIQSGVHV